jgi:hypothetical protein
MALFHLMNIKSKLRIYLIRLLFFVMIVVFTLINNHYFYEHKAKAAARSISSSSADIKAYAKLLSYTENDYGTYTIKLKSYLDNRIAAKKRREQVDIIDAAGGVVIKSGAIWINPVFPGTTTSLSETSGSVEDRMLPFDHKIEITRRAKENLLMSTWNSLTFSIIEIAETGYNNSVSEAWQLAKGIAWRRSRPAFFAAVLCLFAYILFRQRDRAIEQGHLEEIQEKEANLDRVSANEIRLKQERASWCEDRENLTSKKKELEQKIKQEKSSHSADNEASEQLLEEMQCKLDSVQSELEQLKEREERGRKESEENAIEREQLNAGIDQATGSPSKKDEARFKRMLFKNPELKLLSSQGDTKCSPGKHHSKDYVRDLAGRLQKQDRYIERITSTDYNAKLKGKIILTKNERGCFQLKIYDNKKDAGYAACLDLRTSDYTSSIILAKYIIYFSARELRKFNIINKIG